MSKTTPEFMGRLSILDRLRALEHAVARMQRYAGDNGETAAMGAARDGDTSRAVPPMRPLNARWINNFEASAIARPFSLVPLDAAGNVDYRRAGGGTIYANRVVAGAGSDIAMLDSVNSTYRIWVGASAAGSATFSVTKGGALKATSGSVGGWTIGATTIDGANATLDSAGSVVIGSGDDVVVLSAIDGTRRLWVGAANPATAPFRVTKAGAVTMTNVTATGGTVGGWTIGATTIAGTEATMDSAGSIVIGTGDDVVVLSAIDSTRRLWVGAANPATAPFRVTKAGALTTTNVTATGGTVGGFTLTSNTIKSGSFGLDQANNRFTFNAANSYIWQTGAAIFIVYGGTNLYQANTDTTLLSADLNVAGSTQVTADIYTPAGNLVVLGGGKVMLEGRTGDTYFKYNSVNSKVELYVNNVLTASWP